MRISGVLDTPVQSVITSPPYWDLKDYGHDNQIGKGDESYQKYLNRIENVLEGCYQNLRESGTIWLVADSFVQRGDTKLLPYHLTQKAQEVGFHLQNVIVWYKPTAIGGYNDRTVVNKKEYVLFLSKNIDYDLFIEQDEGSGLEDPANAAEERLNNVWRHPIKTGEFEQGQYSPQSSISGLANRANREYIDGAGGTEFWIHSSEAVLRP